MSEETNQIVEKKAASAEQLEPDQLESLLMNIEHIVIGKNVADDAK